VKACRIRPEDPADVEVVRQIHLSAFPGDVEARLVDALRDSGRLFVSLVAVIGETVVGHIALSPVTLTPAAESARGYGLAPVAVLESYRGRGIGGELVIAGVSASCDAGADFIVVLGAPAYYGRFGFERAGKWRLLNAFGVDEEFMALPCSKGGIPASGGLVTYSREFDEL
jgi:putative acetyltransferase